MSMERETSALALAPAPAAVAVVSRQFCAPHVVPLTVTKKAMSFSGGDFTVTDDGSGAVVLRVKGTYLSIRSHRVLHDAAGRPILTMQRKESANKPIPDVLAVVIWIGIQVFSMHDKWKVFRGDSTATNDLLFTVKRTSLFQLKTKLDVFLAGNTTAEEVCDFQIKGSYFERSCAFYRGSSNVPIAQMNRKFTMSNVLLGKDTYCVNVFPHVDYVFIAALVVILDEIHRDSTSK